MKVYLYLILFFLLLSCQTKKEDKSTGQKKTISLQYANGFNIEKEGDFTYITVSNPWPEADKPFVYLLAPKGTTPTKNKTYDAFISVPISRLVVTSTTHIPALEALGVLNTLVGFPDTRYISSEAARKRIDNGSITELGVNESINTEILLELAPEVVIGFSINNQNKTYQTIERSGIPVVYNGDWNETSPLGKAEWIKFFAPFFQKESLADSLFNEIKSNYQQAKEIAANATKRPTVFSGAMYKDVWYLPAGESWAAQFIEDANAEYLWKDTKGTGSLALSIESVYDTAINADFWISPSQFTNYTQMESANKMYMEFAAFKQKHIYTYNKTIGATGGSLYFELAPQRPNLILKDLIYIFHPELMPEHELFFFKPLD